MINKNYYRIIKELYNNNTNLPLQKIKSSGGTLLEFKS